MCQWCSTSSWTTVPAASDTGSLRLSESLQVRLGTTRRFSGLCYSESYSHELQVEGNNYRILPGTSRTLSESHSLSPSLSLSPCLSARALAESPSLPLRVPPSLRVSLSPSLSLSESQQSAPADLFQAPVASLPVFCLSCCVFTLKFPGVPLPVASVGGPTQPTLRSSWSRPR